MTKIDINHIAHLAELPIPEEKKKVLEEQLETTLAHVERLNKLDTLKVDETNTVTNLSNVTREDIVEPSLSQEEALQNAKHTHNGFFVVPVILEEAVA